jgi:hypothetical protein
MHKLANKKRTLREGYHVKYQFTIEAFSSSSPYKYI